MLNIAYDGKVYTWQMRSSWKGMTSLLTGFANQGTGTNEATSLSY